MRVSQILFQQWDEWDHLNKPITREKYQNAHPKVSIDKGYFDCDFFRFIFLEKV